LGFGRGVYFAFRVSCLGLGLSGIWFRVHDSRFRLQGLGLRALGRYQLLSGAHTPHGRPTPMLQASILGAWQASFFAFHTPHFACHIPCFASRASNHESRTLNLERFTPHPTPFTPHMFHNSHLNFQCAHWFPDVSIPVVVRRPREKDEPRQHGQRQKRLPELDHVWRRPVSGCRISATCLAV